ncbi:hypothetical protein BRO54_1598 [Geobacillus proteiniphilus]|uniref:Uncharacterized protein n=1 Tax=Geobacillus proteiniphilus TaxID=860353 RepID=A0A1Q5T1Y9_9BACL|nr:hypothetical protein BRO54_1598 [Geobacillus proteiniphilus]
MENRRPSMRIWNGGRKGRKKMNELGILTKIEQQILEGW